MISHYIYIYIYTLMHIIVCVLAEEIKETSAKIAVDGNHVGGTCVLFACIYFDAYHV